MRPIRLALVGCGWFANVAHLPAIKRLEEEGKVQLAGLFSRNPTSIKKAQAVIGRPVRAYANYAELMASDEIDAVDLVLPTPLMHSAVSAALHARKCVISEKPCASNISQAEALLEIYAAQRGEAIWAVAENWRFKPSVTWIAELIQQGSLGQIQRIDFEYGSTGWNNDGGWRSNPTFKGGYLLDSGVHFVSMLRQLAGGVTQVDACIGWRPPNRVAEDVIAQVNYEEGLGTFRVSFTQALASEPDDFQLRVKGDLGELRANFLTAKVEFETSKGIEQRHFSDDPWVQGGVYPMLRHCLDKFVSKQEPTCSAIEAMKDLVVIEAMMQSSRIGKAVNPSLLHRQLYGSLPNLRTFGGLQNISAKQVVNCSTLDDVKTSMRERNALGLKVRPLGAGQSWAPYLLSEDVSLRVHGLKRIRKIDPKRKTVCVGAGVRLGDLTKALAIHGLCLPSLPFFADATIGGAVSTGMHGTSPHFGTLSDFVSSLRLINAAGEEILIDRKSPAGFLQAARVAIGLLGIIVEIEFDLISIPWARNVKIDLSLEEFMDLRPTLFDRFGHIWVHWILGQKKMVVQCLELSSEPKEGYRPYVSGDKACWIPAYQGPVEQVRGESLMSSMQYALELQAMEVAIREVNASAFAHQNSGKEIEIKFLKKSDGTFLGANSGWEAVCFNTWWPVEKSHVNIVFQPLEEIMRGLNARPHWGKLHTRPTKDYLKSCFSLWDQFESIRKVLDPNEVFNFPN